jgi:hypothetical protein
MKTKGIGYFLGTIIFASGRLYSVTLHSRYLREVRQDEAQLLSSSFGLNLYNQLTFRETGATHLLSGDTSELHRSLDLVQDLVLLDDIVDILHETSSDSSGITGVGMEGLDDFLNGDGGVTGSPSVVVSRGTDECVAVESALS